MDRKLYTIGNATYYLTPEQYEEADKEMLEGIWNYECHSFWISSQLWEHWTKSYLAYPSEHEKNLYTLIIMDTTIQVHAIMGDAPNGVHILMDNRVKLKSKTRTYRELYHRLVEPNGWGVHGERMSDFLNPNVGGRYNEAHLEIARLAFYG